MRIIFWIPVDYNIVGNGSRTWAINMLKAMNQSEVVKNVLVLTNKKTFPKFNFDKIKFKLKTSYGDMIRVE